MFGKLIILRNKPWVILIKSVLVAITMSVNIIKRLFIFRKGMALRWVQAKNYLPVLWGWRDVMWLCCPLPRRGLRYRWLRIQ